MTIEFADIERRRMTLSQAVLKEIDALRESGELDWTPRVEPSCYICCELESRNLVNRLIASSMTNREIAECCEVVNARRTEVGDNRVIHAYHVRVHRLKHFPIQEPRNAAYRKIVERRAEEANLDHINDIGHAVVPLAVMETVMVKGYEGIIEAESRPTIEQTMAAATKLHDIAARDANNRKMADMYFMMERIISAAQEFIPETLLPAFLAKVDGQVGPTTIIEAEPSDPPVREFIPKTLRDEDEQL